MQLFLFLLTASLYILFDFYWCSSYGILELKGNLDSVYFIIVHRYIESDFL